MRKELADYKKASSPVAHADMNSSVSSSSPRSPPGRPSKKALAEELEAIKDSVDKVKYPAFPRERNLIDLITFSTHSGQFPGVRLTRFP